MSSPSPRSSTDRQAPRAARRGRGLRGLGRRGLIGVLVGLLLGSAVFGGGAAWAYWTASATATAQVTTPVVKITQSDFPTIFGSDFINTHTSLSKTGSFTIKNESTAAGTASIDIASSGTLAPKLPLIVWPVAAATTCTASTTPGAGAVTADWSSLSLNLGSLAANTSQKFCARTTVSVGNRPTLASDSGAMTASATLTARLDVSGWVATDTSGTATQKTADIFPVTSDYRPASVSDWFTLSSGSASGVGSGQCLDVANYATTDGSPVVSWSCLQNDNQAWQIRPVSGSNPQMVTVRPLSIHTRNLGVNAAGATQIQTPSTADAQRWFVQKATSGKYQLVSASTGKCLALGTGGASATVDCTAAGSKIFLNRLKLTATKSGNNLVLNLPVNNINTPMVVQYYRGALLGWVTAETRPATGNANAAPASITLRTTSMLAVTGDTDMRIVLTTGTPGAEDVALTFVVNRVVLFGPLTMVSGDG